jgi:hypothetical protein
MSLHYTAEEEAVLAEYVDRQVECWRTVLRRIPRRSRPSAEKRLNLMRRKAGTLWTVPQGGAF